MQEEHNDSWTLQNKPELASVQALQQSKGHVSSESEAFDKEIDSVLMQEQPNGTKTQLLIGWRLRTMKNITKTRNIDIVWL